MNTKPKIISKINMPDPDNPETNRIIGFKISVSELEKTGLTFGLWTDLVELSDNAKG